MPNTVVTAVDQDVDACAEVQGGHDRRRCRQSRRTGPATLRWMAERGREHVGRPRHGGIPGGAAVVLAGVGGRGGTSRDDPTGDDLHQEVAGPGRSGAPTRGCARLGPASWCDRKGDRWRESGSGDDPTRCDDVPSDDRTVAEEKVQLAPAHSSTLSLRHDRG